MFKKYDKFNTFIQENLIAVRVVKAFVRSGYEKKKFKKANDELMGAALHAEKLMIMGMPTFTIIMYGTILAILYIAAREITQEKIKDTVKQLKILNEKNNIYFNAIAFYFLVIGGSVTYG